MSHDDVGSRVQRELFLRSITETELSRAQMAQMVRLFRDVAFAEGDHLFRRGRASELAFFIIEGRVELRCPDTAPWKFEGPAAVGILDALLGEPHARDAVATTDVRALEMVSEDYFEFLEDNYDFCQAIIDRNCNDLLDLALSLGDPGPIFQQCGPGGLLHHSRRGYSLVERLLILRRLRPFSRASTQALSSLARLAEETTFVAGETIFRQGDPVRSVYIIARGELSIARDEPAIQTTRRAGEIIDGYSAFGDRPRQFTATAISDGSLLRLHREDFFDRMEEHFDLTRSVFAFMADERRILNQAISDDPELSRTPRSLAGN